MAISIIKPLPKSTVELEITIPWVEIKDNYQKIFNDTLKAVEISGFRKGKVPKDLAEKNINKTKIYEQVIKERVPQAYSLAIKEHNLTPVSSPKVEILQAKENENWKLKATVALKPEINLKNYKQKIRDLKKNKTKIWTPGQEQKNDKKDNMLSLDEILDAIISEVNIEISDLIVDEEINRLLANLIDQTQKLGLTVEQYLISKDKTRESIRAEYREQAIKNIAIEFALTEIADEEKITVTQSDLDKLIEKVEKIEEKEKLKKDSYYLAHLIRQQKTLDYLKNL